MTTIENVPDTHEMVIVHRVFRRSFAEMPGLVRGVPAGDAARAGVVVAYLRAAADGLHHHHADEDALLWPLLLGRVELERPLVLKMEEQHQRLAQLLGTVRDQAAAFERTAGPAERAALAATLDRLQPAVVEHLDDEEQQVLPLVREHITVPEWIALGDRGREHLSKSQLLVQLGYLLDGCSPAEEAGFLAKMPVAARLAWRLVGRRAYDKERAAVLGAT